MDCSLSGSWMDCCLSSGCIYRCWRICWMDCCLRGGRMKC